MLGLVPSASLLGVDGHAVTVEVHVSSGLPSFTVVGSPDAACREASDRVRAALLSTGLTWPPQRVTVNLAPPTVRKIGSGLDLAIAVALLVASEQIRPEAVEGRAFLGELGLDGSLRPVPGVLCLTEALGAAGAVVVPAASAAEATLVGGRMVHPLARLSEVVACLQGEAPWPTAAAAPPAPLPPLGADLADVRGQPVARYALEVAAAGGHHLLMLGPPGAGKTMLASRLPGLLPPLTDDQALETTRIHSAAGLGLPVAGLVRRPPFRAPHHGASSVALVGGGSAAMRPGEISTATNGVLFLDELAEFAPSVLDALRQPLEEGVVRVARAVATVSFPARFLLVAAMNPCPCGYGGRPGGCRCTDGARARYQRRLSGPAARPLRPAGRGHPPLGDRADGRAGRGEPTATVRDRVVAARRLAPSEGWAPTPPSPLDRLDELAPLASGAGRRAGRAALRSGRLSARGLHRVRRVARTVADLQGAAPRGHRRPRGHRPQPAGRCRPVPSTRRQVRSA